VIPVHRGSSSTPRARERSFLTDFWQYVHRYLLRDSVHFSGSAGIASMLEQAGCQDVRVVVQLRRVLWKNKLYISLAVIRGTGPLARPVRTA
jgi:hypothetical protein